MNEQRQSFIEMNNVGVGVEYNGGAGARKKKNSIMIALLFTFVIVCSIIMVSQGRNNNLNGNAQPAVSDRFYQNQLNLLQQSYRTPLKDIRTQARVVQCSICKKVIGKDSLFGQSTSAHYDLSKRNCPLRPNAASAVNKIEAETLFFHKEVSTRSIFTKEQLLQMIQAYPTNENKAAYLDGIISVGAKLEGLSTAAEFRDIRPLLKKF